jgi:hypothetical protein
MPRYIIKLQDQDQAWYLEWSTIVDAPVTRGLPLKEFKYQYIDEHGLSALEELEQRLERVEKTGTSAFDRDLEKVILCNRAGPNEERLTKQQLIDKYCTGNSST